MLDLAILNLHMTASVQELQKSVVVAPDEGYEKYMYLGQLLQGPEALAATQKGIELLQQVWQDGD